MTSFVFIVSPLFHQFYSTSFRSLQLLLPLSSNKETVTMTLSVLRHVEKLCYWLTWWAALSLFLSHNPHNPSVLAANTTHSTRPQGQWMGAYCRHLLCQCTERGFASAYAYINASGGMHRSTQMSMVFNTESFKWELPPTHALTFGGTFSWLHHRPGTRNILCSPKVTQVHLFLCWQLNKLTHL